MAKRTSLGTALLAVWLLSCGDGGTEPEPGPQQQPNRAPVAAGSIPAQHIVAGTTATVDVSSYFTDPDGDALNFTAASSDERVATVAVSAGSVTVTAVGEGVVTVTVTGRDPGGLGATQSFAVTVPVPNRAPVLLDSIPARFMLVGDTAELDVSPYFADPDDDVLTYAAASSDTAVVASRVSGNSVTLAAAALGSATVTVTARDPGGLEASQGFAVRVDSTRTAVTLAHTAVALPEGTLAVLEVALSTAPSAPISVAFTLGSDTDPATADADTADFGMATGTIEIPAGRTGALFEIAVADDSEPEPVREVFTVTLDEPASAAAYELGSPSTATVTILEGVCDRTRQVREVIVARAPADRCSDIDSAHLASIDTLRVGTDVRDNITSLHGEDFQGLSNLRVLELSAIQVSELPLDLFSDLTRLEWLVLAIGDLSTTSPDVFSGLQSLTHLWLSGNGSRQIPEGLFSRLSKLETLLLAGNALTGLSPGVFAGLSNLNYLHLRNNGLVELPPRVFSELSNLESLLLSEDDLRELAPNVFDGLSNLEGLVVASKALAELPPELFSGLSGLQRLNLDANALTALPPGIFSGLSSLVGLRLRNNRLEALPAGLLSGLTALTWLFLDENQLTRLPAGLFSDLGKLERLYLHENQLVTLEPGMFSALSSLTELHLNQNRLADLPDRAFSGLSSLGLLDLTENQLTRLPAGIFSDLPALLFLALRGNPGRPFELALELRRTDSGNLLAPGPATVAVRIAEGAPKSMDIRLSVHSGTLSADRVSIAKGAEWSSEVTVTRPANVQLPTRVEILRVPRFTPPPYFDGITFKAGDRLILFGGSASPGNQG